MKLVLRVDDVGLIPHGGQDRGLELAKRFHDAMDGLPYLTAVIPGILDRSGVEWIRSRPARMTVALHGWTHAKGMSGGECEYQGMGRGMCIYALERGLGILGDGILDFVPPWNATTPELLGACRRVGLNRIWGQPYASERPFPPEPKDFGLFIPSWIPLYGATAWRMADDRPALLDVLPAVGDVTAVMVLHITWEASFSKTFDGVKRLIAEYGDTFISPEEYTRPYVQ